MLFFVFSYFISYFKSFFRLLKKKNIFINSLFDCSGIRNIDGCLSICWAFICLIFNPPICVSFFFLLQFPAPAALVNVLGIYASAIYFSSTLLIYICCYCLLLFVYCFCSEEYKKNELKIPRNGLRLQNIDVIHSKVNGYKFVNYL